MAWSRTDIANRALGALGVKKAITDVDTDTNAEAKAVREVLDLAIESLVAECDWPMARRTEEMSLVSGSSTSPYSDDWVYAYRYSTTWMKLIRVQQEDGGDRQPSESSMCPYRVISDTSGRLVLTDEESAEAEVLVLPDEGHYPAKFVEALALKVAIMAGPRLAGDVKNGSSLQQMYEMALSNAMATAANEQGYFLPLDPQGIRARRGSGTYRTGQDWTAYGDGYTIS